MASVIKLVAKSAAQAMLGLVCIGIIIEASNAARLMRRGRSTL